MTLLICGSIFYGQSSSVPLMAAMFHVRTLIFWVLILTLTAQNELKIQADCQLPMLNSPIKHDSQLAVVGNCSDVEEIWNFTSTTIELPLSPPPNRTYPDLLEAFRGTIGQPDCVQLVLDYWLNPMNTEWMTVFDLIVLCDTSVVLHLVIVPFDRHPKASLANNIFLEQCFPFEEYRFEFDPIQRKFRFSRIDVVTNATLGFIDIVEDDSKTLKSRLDARRSDMCNCTPFMTYRQALLKCRGPLAQLIDENDRKRLEGNVRPVTEDTVDRFGSCIVTLMAAVGIILVLAMEVRKLIRCRVTVAPDV